MSSVFIVRPFGNRSVLKKDAATQTTSTVKFDFDKVEKELIRPAMAGLNLTGGTTGEIFASGSIHEDMFNLLLMADIVIADITIHNANVYYELGVRHSLRDKKTILIKCPGYDEVPFDITGFRYVTYDIEKPGDTVSILTKTIKETIADNRQDSPVFKVLPLLTAQDPERYLALPEDFIAEVKITEQTKLPGKLALLAYEAEGFDWRLPAFRMIGNALFRMGERNTAKQVWKKITAEKPNDVKANEKLSTIFQRLAEMEMKINPEEGLSLLAQSDLATDILINNDELSSYQKAEAYALKARNAKTRWISSWKDAAGDDRFKKALQSLHLDTAFKNYEKGFYEDLNHYYSGINALGLITTIITLAEKDPATWESAYDTPEDATQKLNELKKKSQRMAAVVQTSIEAAKNKFQPADDDYKWAISTEADLLCLTSTNPLRVANTYTKVLQDAEGLNMDATVRQLKIYEALGVKTDNIKAVLELLPPVSEQPASITNYLLFTGHMIDKPDRAEPRFPAAKEAAVRQAIKDKIMAAQKKLPEGGSLTGISGGACGGDILFLEVCQELGIPAHMLLAMPREEFLKASVAFAGSEWIERFDKLCDKFPHPVLSDSAALPKWLQKKQDYTIWMRNNLWLLNRSLINGGMHMSLIALWDGKGGDGEGGTEDMVKQANDRGAKVEVIDIKNI